MIHDKRGEQTNRREATQINLENVPFSRAACGRPATWDEDLHNHEVPTNEKHHKVKGGYGNTMSAKHVETITGNEFSKSSRAGYSSEAWLRSHVPLIDGHLAQSVDLSAVLRICALWSFSQLVIAIEVRIWKLCNWKLLTLKPEILRDGCETIYHLSRMQTCKGKMQKLQTGYIRSKSKQNHPSPQNMMSPKPVTYRVDATCFLPDHSVSIFVGVTHQWVLLRQPRDNFKTCLRWQKQQFWPKTAFRGQRNT